LLNCDLDSTDSQEIIMLRSQFRLHALSAALVSLGLTTNVLAQNNTANNDAPTAPTATQSQGMTGNDAAKQNGVLTSGDRKFVEKAARGGMAETQLSQLAEQKASNDQVKEFAQKMTEDHAKANDDLKQIASTKGVQVPATLDHGEQREMQKLQKLSGADFDREYMKRMVKDHKDTLGAFEKESKSGKDAEVKSFATETLPTLRDHMQMAQAINDSVKQTNKSSSSTTRSSSNGGMGNKMPNDSTTTSGATSK
jgi:putative membrane protein